MTWRAADGACGAEVIACNTCRNGDAPGAGAALVQALQRAKADDQRYDGIAVEQVSCLFACQQGCTIHLRAAGKWGYVLGRFTAEEELARAMLDFALLYADSADGQVAYRDWPQGVKGRFLTRMPPAGMLPA
ncbi:DUF1636 domain-containing protein [Sphingomonas sp.]|jgi:predicted metal-binding protein|uniref:DUF1636 domain-containing protein n=1 Tax=Sphingomonas sp. TaxID=28214 RepID=UPI0035C87E1D